MVRVQNANGSSNLQLRLAGKPVRGSSLEIDAWIPSEIKRISPLVERLMPLIAGARGIAGQESAVEPALREALNNAVIHGNRLDARKRVHVRCRCKVGEGISLLVSDQGQGFDAQAIPDPMNAENREAVYGRGIQLMKFSMDTVSFERNGAEVRMSKKPAHNAATQTESSWRSV
jgi:serine/threonine-protein kinase RsbW